MKLLAYLRRADRRIRRKKLSEAKQELLVQIGREQFKKLIDRGLNVPVAYL